MDTVTMNPRKFVGVGIDPSFRAAGVCAHYITPGDDTATVVLDVLSVDRSDKSFLGTYNSAHAQATQIRDWITSNIPNDTPVVAVLETPPPVGQYSAGLYLLCGFISYSLTRLGISLVTVPPNKIKSMHGNRKASKRDSSNLAKDMLFIYSPGKLIHKGKESTAHLIVGKGKGRFNIRNDEAEAFLLMSLLCRLPLPDYVNPEKWTLEVNYE